MRYLAHPGRVPVAPFAVPVPIPVPVPVAMAVALTIPVSPERPLLLPCSEEHELNWSEPVECQDYLKWV